MILSASRRTDIPAWHSDLLLAALRRGWIDTANPFRPSQISRTSLRAEDVDAMIIWTRDARALLPHLDGPLLGPHRSVFQYTITGYGPPLEPGIPNADVGVEAMRGLAERLGPDRVIWRYDPLILGDGSLTADAHRARFSRLAAALDGSTRRVVISLVDWYRKTTRALRPHLDGLQSPHVSSLEPEDPSVLGLVSDLREIASARGIEAVGCCEPAWDAQGVLPAGACIDAALLRRLWDLPIPKRKDPRQRPACRCAPSKDIGDYDTCRGGACTATLAQGRRAP